MVALAYLLTLLAVIGCMALLDHRFGLVFWADARRGLLTIALGTVVFLLWDVAAIAAGFYHKGDSSAMTGIMFGPELPLEELVFIVFLCYLTLVVHGLMTLLLRRRREPAARVGKEQA